MPPWRSWLGHWAAKVSHPSPDWLRRNSMDSPATTGRARSIRRRLMDRGAGVTLA